MWDYNDGEYPYYYDGELDLSDIVTDKYIAYAHSYMSGTDIFYIADTPELAEETIARFKYIVTDGEYSDDAELDSWWNAFYDWIDANNIITICDDAYEQSYYPELGVLVDGHAGIVYDANIVATYKDRF